MRVLILEPHSSGHHAYYVRWLVEAADRKGWSAVIASTSAAASHPALATVAADFSDVQLQISGNPPIIDVSRGGKWRLVRKEYLYWRLLKKAAAEVFAQTAIDAVILPYADYCFFALAALGSPFGSHPWCAISMRWRVNDPASKAAPLKWRMANRILGNRNLKALFSINPSIANVPANWSTPRLLSKLRYLRDPAPESSRASRPESRSSLEIAAGQVAVLVFGMLDHRKGIDALLTCLASGEELASYVVILAGRQTTDTAAALKSPRYSTLRSDGRLKILDRFLSDAEQETVFAAADLVWVGYRNHIYMSGVLVLAGKAGLPVIGTAGGEIGGLIARFDLGLAASIDDTAGVSRALALMLDGEARRRMGANALAAFADHTVPMFGAAVLAAFEP